MPSWEERDTRKLLPSVLSMGKYKEKPAPPPHIAVWQARAFVCCKAEAKEGSEREGESMAEKRERKGREAQRERQKD
jgi:hypothetical protein